MHSGLNAILSCRLRTEWQEPTHPEGNAELVNECPHGADIQKHNKGSALVKTIVGIEVL